MIQDNQLTSYQTHRLIKDAIPSARTVYERDNKSQMTFDEYLQEELEAQEVHPHDYQSSFRFLNGL